MRRLFLKGIICLTALLSATPAWSATLKGSVRYKLGNASIPKAYLIVHRVGDTTNKSDFYPEIDAKGNFSVDLAPGYYYLYIGAPGFAPDCKEFHVEDAKPTIYNAKLKASEMATPD